MNTKFERLTFDEVISPTIGGLNLPHTFKVKELIEIIKRNMGGASTNLFENDGLELEVLRLDAKGWRKGKVRFSLEFCPDEPDIEETLTTNQLETSKLESPLDEIRRMMPKDS
jgi:hypothetical protein